MRQFLAAISFSEQCQCHVFSLTLCLQSFEIIFSYIFFSFHFSSIRVRLSIRWVPIIGSFERYWNTPTTENVVAEFDICASQIFHVYINVYRKCLNSALASCWYACIQFPADESSIHINWFWSLEDTRVKALIDHSHFGHLNPEFPY